MDLKGEVSGVGEGGVEDGGYLSKTEREERWRKAEKKKVSLEDTLMDAFSDRQTGSLDYPAQMLKARS